MKRSKNPPLGLERLADAEVSCGCVDQTRPRELHVLDAWAEEVQRRGGFAVALSAPKERAEFKTEAIMHSDNLVVFKTPLATRIDQPDNPEKRVKVGGVEGRSRRSGSRIARS